MVTNTFFAGSILANQIDATANNQLWIYDFDYRRHVFDFRHTDFQWQCQSVELEIIKAMTNGNSVELEIIKAMTNGNIVELEIDKRTSMATLNHKE